LSASTLGGVADLRAARPSRSWTTSRQRSAPALGNARPSTTCPASTLGAGHRCSAEERSLGKSWVEDGAVVGAAQPTQSAGRPVGHLPHVRRTFPPAGNTLTPGDSARARRPRVPPCVGDRPCPVTVDLPFCHRRRGRTRRAEPRLVPAERAGIDQRRPEECIGGLLATTRRLVLQPESTGQMWASGQLIYPID
jgi:hypothetical protein